MTHPFEFGDKVFADGDRDNAMTAVAFLYEPGNYTSVKCVYWVNGDHKEVWIPEWRLRKKEEL